MLRDLLLRGDVDSLLKEGYSLFLYFNRVLSVEEVVGSLFIFWLKWKVIIWYLLMIELDLNFD